MGTRATYSFGLDAQVTLYNHWDNYPEGAIHFIWAAFNATDQTDKREKSKRANLRAEDFIRGNHGFEITESHALHGDTEYRYYFAGTTLRVDQRINFSDEWETIHDGPWWEFVEAYKDNEHMPLTDYEPFIIFDGEKYLGPRPMTLSMLKSKRDSVQNLLGIWAANGHTIGSNWESNVSLYKNLDKAIKGAGYA